MQRSSSSRLARKRGAISGIRPGTDPLSNPSRWFWRILIATILTVGFVVIWSTNQFLTARSTEATRARMDNRAALYIGNLLSELQRTAVVPQLLVRDPVLANSLSANDYSTTSARLISAQKEIGTASIRLLDATGRIVGATDRQRLGQNLASEAFFVDALRSRDTVFSVTPLAAGGFDFTYSRVIMAEGRTLGVIVVGADLARLERSWAGISDAVAVLDAEGRIILATESRWRRLSLEQALEVRPATTAIERAFQVTADWTRPAADVWLRGQAVLQSETRIPFRGWRMVIFTTQASIRERVNAVLALEIMGFALLLAGSFYLQSRRARVQTAAYRRESADLRALNARLTREIAERERVQHELRVAEQTVEQSSKLAVLGEMSAGVSHELNQPLAAMKTYLAGARLLLQRGRPDEAMSSFQRIDDLIERMTTITRQLKSFARKGGEAFEIIDLRSAVSGALTLMEPQLRARRLAITRRLPRQPVLVHCDRIRMEQVIVNLLRNAIDATRSVSDPRMEITLEDGVQAVLTIRDNGEGVKDFERLFEPFFTTKNPGEGTGLGLAISSGIITDFGGRLTAYNVEDGPGAIFEVVLPIFHGEATATRATG